MQNKYYALDWKHDGYNEFNIYAHVTPGDGHCMLHSILFCLLREYKYFRGDQMIEVRKCIAKRLITKNKTTGQTLYENIGDGVLKTMGNNSFEYSQRGINTLLCSNRFLGYDILLIIEHIFNINVYVLDKKTNDIYMTHKEDDRNSVVIYYTNDHFESISLLTSDGDHQTYFSSRHPFIQLLRQKLK